VADVDQAPVLLGKTAAEEIDRPPTSVPLVHSEGVGEFMQVGHDGQLADQDDSTLGGDVMR
jgi:hypothetical protein